MRISTLDPGTTVPLAEIDLYDPERYRQQDQHAAWLTLRQHAPVWWHERPGQPGFWSVTGHADCERVLKEHRTFSSASGTVLDSVGTGDPAGGRTISLMDPPDHTTIRTDTMRRFSHGAIREKSAVIQAEVRRLIEPLLDGEQDFAVLMRRLPMAVSGALIGVPEEDWDPLAYWTAAGIAPESPEFSNGSTVANVLRRAHHEIFARFSELILHRRRYPADDLISTLMEVRIDGRRMDDTEVLLNCYSFMAGANSTTPHVASHTMLALMDRPAVWASLAEDPDRIPGALEEGVRWTGTPHHLVRRTLHDTTIGGVAISEGDWVCAWLASAQRDEKVFPDPYVFDPGRPINQNIGFGVGPHYCIGAALSRYVSRMMFDDLVRTFAGFEPAGPVTHMTSNWVNGVMSMPVVGEARHRARV